MSNSSLAFAFDDPSPPVVVIAARTIASELAAGRAPSRNDVTRIMTEHFGGSDALGRWSVRDAHAALELAQVQYLKAVDQISLSTSADQADQFFSSLEARLRPRSIVATSRSNGSSSRRRRALPGLPPGLARWPLTTLCSNRRPERGCSRCGPPRPVRALSSTRFRHSAAIA